MTKFRTLQKVLSLLFLTFFFSGNCQLLILTDQLSGGQIKDQKEIRVIPGGSSLTTTISPGGTLDAHLLIDPAIINNASYQTTQNTGSILASHQLNLTYPVGATEGNYQVTPLGGLTYSIPIDLPPGTNGIMPRVAIVYNSGSMSESVGLGWEISAVSAITRAGKDVYHDAKGEGVQLDNADNFELDGQRLIKINSGSYVLEAEDFSSITFNSVDNFFTVERKDGTKLEYGNIAATADAQLNMKNAANQNVTYSYFLNKVYDNYGNYVEYVYSKYGTNPGEMSLAEIRYTGRQQGTGVQATVISAPYNSIKFYYNERFNKQEKYLLGNLVQRSLILREIEVFADGNSYKKYDFNYVAANYHNLLNEIVESGADNTRLNSTLVVYGNNTAQQPVTAIDPFFEANNVLSPMGDADILVGDFNGDGRSDALGLVFSGSVEVNTGFRAYTGWELYINKGDGTEFNMTDAKSYLPGEISSAFPYEWATSLGHIRNGSQVGDFNSDGKTDLLLARSAANNTEGYQLYLSAGSALQTPSGAHTAQVMAKSQVNIGDYDGDKQIEAFAYLNHTACGDCNVNSGVLDFRFLRYVNGSFLAYLPSTTIGSSPVVSIPGGGGQPLSFYYGLSPIDFDGDGVMELTGIRGGFEVVLKIHDLHFLPPIGNQHLFTWNSLEEIYNAGNFSASPETYGHVLTGDFNGDGIADKVKMVGHNPSSGFSNTSLSYRTGRGYTAPANLSNVQTYFGNMNIKHFAMDINGDGTSEIVDLESFGLGPNGIITVNFTDPVYFNRGFIGSFNSSFPLVKDFTNSFPFYVNGGLTSVIDANMNGNPGEPSQSNTPGSANDDQYSPGLNPEFNTGDFNGDGYEDIMLKTTTANRTIIFFTPLDQKNFVTQVVNGLNNSVEFNYEPLSRSNPAIYSKGTGAAFPVIDFQGPMYVVTSVKEPNGIGQKTVTTYTYSGAKIHLQGRGFLGFDKVVAKNSASLFQTTSTWSSPDPANFFLRLNSQSEVSILPCLSCAPTAQVSHSSLTSSAFQLQPGGIGDQLRRFFKRTDFVSQTDDVAGVTNTTEYFYDASTSHSGPITGGNITKIVAERGNATEQIVTENTYYAQSPWLVHTPSLATKVQTSSTTATRLLPAAQLPFTSQKDYLWYPTGALEQVTAVDPDAGNPKNVVEHYTYDGNTGVLMEEELSAPNASNPPLPVEKTEYTYDSKSRLPVTVKNPAGQVTQATYDFRFGKPLTVTGIDGLKTLFEYDGYGRNTRTESPDQLITTSTLQWYSSSIRIPGDPFIPNFPHFYAKVARPGAPTVIQVFDKLGRVVKQQSDAFKVNGMSSQIEYNFKGEVVIEIDNYLIPIAGNDDTYKLYAYNNLGQLTDITLQNGNSTINQHTGISYSYNNGNTTTAVSTPDPSRSYSRVTDATGQLISATDQAGVLTYEYVSNGQPKIVRLNGTPVTEMDYDERGFQTELKETNSGTSKYEYNAYGMINKQTDFKNQIYNYTYDNLNRLQNASGPEIYTYQYITSGNGIGQVSQVNASNSGTSYQYAYDQLSRLKQLDETVDNMVMTTKYQYDQFSNVINQVYPGGFTVTREYDSQGFATFIKRGDNGRVIWQADEMNRLGQYTKYTLGSNPQTVRAYNGLGLPQSFTTSGIHQLSFNFDNKTGNLMSISDQLKNLTETYTYDASDRLTNWQHGSVSQGVSYAANGNISTKSEIGAYTYSGKPNAVVQVDNPNGLISAVQQDIAYNSFNKVESIIEGANEAMITYGPDQERIKMEMKTGGQTTSTRYYFSEHEKEILANGNTREVSYISAPPETSGGLCALFVNDNGNKDLYFVYTDHLGSINRLVSESNGSVTEQNFDPWGRARNPQTWDFTNVPTPPVWLTRGYTGHENLPQFALINMNGRMYDPLLARMLSPDNEVVDPTNTQMYNRYSYAFNNPLKFIDPTGNNGAGFITGGNVSLSPGSSDFSPTLQGMRGGGGFHHGKTEFRNPGEKREALDEDGQYTRVTTRTKEYAGTSYGKGKEYILSETSRTEYSFNGQSAATYTGTPGAGQGYADAVNPVTLWTGVKNNFSSWDNFKKNTAEGYESGMKNIFSLGLYSVYSDVNYLAGQSNNGSLGYGVGQLAGNKTILGISTYLGLRGFGALRPLNRMPSRFSQIKSGIQKAQEISKKTHNIKLSGGKRMDLKGRHPLSKGHYNKTIKQQFGFPHVYDPMYPGGVRAPIANDYIEVFNLFK